MLPALPETLSYEQTVCLLQSWLHRLVVVTVVTEAPMSRIAQVSGHLERASDQRLSVDLPIELPGPLVARPCCARCRFVPERTSWDEIVSFARLVGYEGDPRADPRTLTPRALLAPARLAGQPILRTQTDERLVDLVRAGYEPAFEAVVARYRRPLMRYCSRILAEGRAEDVVQQTFVKAYDAMKSGDADLNLRAWLYRIAHNTALNALRDRALHHEELSDQYDGVERPDQAVERRQGVRELLAAVQALPHRQRDALVLRELEGRSYEEIATELGVTGGAVRQLLHRARTTVRTAATAVTPVGLLIRLPLAAGADSVGGRVAEVGAGAGAGAMAAKLGATMLATGALVGGIAATPDGERNGDRAKAEPASELGAEEVDGLEPRGEAPGMGGRAHRRGRGEGHQGRRGRGRHQAEHHRSGRRDGGAEHSGRREGEDDRSGSDRHSGSGSGDHSGSDGSGSGDGHSGSGSGSSGSGTSGSGTSGSGGSGSGSSGSGESGSGSSGSGSGETTTEQMRTLDTSGSGSGSSGSD
jgi:RNA polymerase sigma factor (sigma-70 family)